jgi:hypothetical protein
VSDSTAFESVRESLRTAIERLTVCTPESMEAAECALSQALASARQLSGLHDSESHALRSDLQLCEQMTVIASSVWERRRNSTSGRCEAAVSAAWVA